jgi:haloacid dehalogenase-like hydrolase
MILGRALHRAGLVDRRELAAWMAREAAFARRGEGTSTAARLLAALLASVAGREATPYLAVARDLGDELAGAARPAARWLLDGTSPWATSASWSRPAPSWWRRRPGPWARTAVGTRTEVAGGCFTGALEGPFCHGRGKLARLWVELGTADLSEATAYSDSASDLPLLEAAGRPVAVNPDRRLRKAALAAGWPVVRLV